MNEGGSRNTPCDFDTDHQRTLVALVSAPRYDNEAAQFAFQY